ncbi:MAG: hypothetical protein ACON4M_01600, partial [Crocinitomicaceae bacterium]
MRKVLLLLLVFVSFISNAQNTCADAIVIGSIPYNQTGLTTCGAGDDYSSSSACGSSYMNGDDYVFEYTPSINQSLSIQLANVGSWVGLFVTQGCPDVGSCISSDTQVSSNPSLVAALTGGVTYYIIISTYPSPQCTPFDIDISEIVYGADDCTNAIQMDDGVIYNSSNIAATADLCLGSGSTDNNVWFEWCAPSDWTGDSFINLYDQNCSTSSGLQMSVFDANINCAAIICSGGTSSQTIASFNCVCTSDQSYSWTPTPGSCYLINIDGYGGTTCNFSLVVNDNNCQTFYTTAITDESCTGNDGAYDVTIDYGSGPFDVVVKDDLGGTVFTGSSYALGASFTVGSLSAGDYVMEITNNSSCQSSQNFTIGSNVSSDDPSFTLSPTCDGGTATITGTVGGTFTFTTPPSDAAVIDATTGTITGGTSGATYDVTYTTSGACSATSNQTVTVTTADDATFTMTGTCDGGTATVTGTPGGTFSFTTPPSDAAVIDATTGTVSGGTSGTLYDVTYTTSGTCSATSNQTVTATSSDDASFTMTGTCDGGTATITGTLGGTFSFTTPPSDAAIIDATTGTITGGTSGTL